MATGASTAPVGVEVRVQCLTCQSCGFEFVRPSVRGRPASFCTDCRPLQQETRHRVDSNSVGYRWAHAVTNQRIALELVRTGLRTAMLGSYDGPKLEVAVREALAQLDAVIDGRTGATVGARAAA